MKGILHIPGRTSSYRYTYFESQLQRAKELIDDPSRSAQPQGIPVPEVVTASIIPGLTPLGFFWPVPGEPRIYIPRQLMANKDANWPCGTKNYSDLVAAMRDAGRAILVRKGLGKTTALLLCYWSLAHSYFADGEANPIPIWLNSAQSLHLDRLACCPPILFFVDLPESPSEAESLVRRLRVVAQNPGCESHRFVFAYRGWASPSLDPVARGILEFDPLVFEMEPLYPEEAEFQWIGQGVDPELLRNLKAALGRRAGQTLKLTWSLLLDVSKAIAKQRFRDQVARFDEIPYTQRRDLKQVLDDFLLSEKTALLLLGKTGAGKTSFLVSLRGEYEEGTTCILWYDARKLEVDRPLNETLESDFEGQLQHITGVEDWHLKNWLQELSHIEGIKGRNVILCIDAINENTEAPRLVQRLNALLDTSIHPWFKVILTSQVYTWRAILRDGRVRPSPSRFYLPIEATNAPLRAQPTLLGIELQPFSDREAREAYVKYQSKYGLETKFEDIPMALLPAIYEPEKLDLVAKTYAKWTNAKGQIPPDARAGEIYQKYIEQLVNDGRVRSEDLRFLEDELMPLMISSGHFENSISSQQVERVDMTLGRQLRSVIFGELSSIDQGTNRSFLRLAEAEIVAREGSDRDYSVLFKHDNFYDYFAGRQIYALAMKEADASGFLLELSQSLGAKPFLWNPIKNAVVQILKENTIEPIYELCKASSERARDLVGSALIELGHEDASSARYVLRSFLAKYTILRKSPDSGLSSRIRSSMMNDPIALLLDRGLEYSERPMMATIDGIGRLPPNLLKVGGLMYRRFMDLVLAGRQQGLDSDDLAAQVAIVAAYNLKSIEILEEIVSDFRLRRIWDTALEYICFLATTDPWTVIQILRSVAPKAAWSERKVLNPSFAVAGGVISLALALAHSQDAQILSTIRSTWKPVLEQLFRRAQTPHGSSRVKTNRFSNLVMLEIFSYLFLIGSPGNFNARELRRFYGLSSDARETFRRIAPYVDPAHGDVQDIAGDILKAGESRDHMTFFVLGFLLARRGMSNPDKVVPILRALFDRTIQVSPPGPYPQGICAMLYMIIDSLPSIDPDLVRLLGSFVWQQWDKSGGCYVSDTGTKYQFPWIDRYIFYFHRLHSRDSICVPLSLLRRLRREKQKEDFSLHQYLLGAAENIAGTYGETELALRIVELAVETHDKPSHLSLMSSQAMSARLVDALATIRKLDEFDVDHFMEAQGYPDSFRQRVKVHTPRAIQSAFPRGFGATILPRVAQSKGMNSAIIRIVNQLQKHHSLQESTGEAIRQVLNFVYGDTLV